MQIFFLPSTNKVEHKLISKFFFKSVPTWPKYSPLTFKKRYSFLLCFFHCNNPLALNKFRSFTCSSKTRRIFTLDTFCVGDIDQYSAAIFYLNNWMVLSCEIESNLLSFFLYFCSTCALIEINLLWAFIL